MIFIRHRTAENNQRHMSHGFRNILFGDNMHYVDLFPIGVFGKSGTTKIWGGAFAPPAPPLATPLIMLYVLSLFHCLLIIQLRDVLEHTYQHIRTDKDSYKYSFYPRTIIQWNLLPIHVHEAVTVDAFKALVPVTVLAPIYHV